MLRIAMVGLCVLVLTACDTDSPTDAGRRDSGSGRVDAGNRDAARACERNADCSDEVFCNGVESCVDSLCQPGSAPCPTGERCSEATRACSRSECSGPDNGDADGDGRRSIACGGDDCDDEDSNRYPGNAEVCDVEDHDEDCDGSTFGFRDSDGDGHPDSNCCNDDVCGSDCNDAAPGVGPTVPEVCGDAIDNDCDGTIDEGVARNCWRDVDGDGYAARDAEVMTDCDCPSGWTDREPTSGSTDCLDDADAGGADVFPGATELCDGIDTDCSDGDTLTTVDGEDMDGDGHAALDAACTGGFPRDDCMDDHELVFTGQTQYFPLPWCPRSLSGGDVACIEGRGCSCFSDMTLPSFDYDCSGDLETAPTHTSCTNAAGDPICLLDGPPPQCIGDGPVAPQPAESCGSRVPHTSCNCAPSGSITGAACFGTAVSARLRCR